MFRRCRDFATVALVFYSLSAFNCGVWAQQGQALKQADGNRQERIAEALPVEVAISTLSFAAFSSISLSPDGEWVAYTLQNLLNKGASGFEHRAFSNAGVPLPFLEGCDVWITNTVSGESINLTEGKGSSWGPNWSPDGKRLAFYSSRSGKARLWVWERSSRHLRQLSDEIVRVNEGNEVPRWTADGARVLAKILPEGMSIEQATEVAASSARLVQTKKESDAKVVVYRAPSAGPGKEANAENLVGAWANQYVADLALIDVLSGKVQRLTRGYKPVGAWLSPDGSHLAFTTAKGWKGGSAHQNLFDLVAVSLPSGRLRTVATDIRQIRGQSASWSPDGKLLSYTTLGPGAKGEGFIVSVDEGQPRNVTETPHPSWAHPYRASLWDAAGKYLYFLSPNAIWKVSAKDGVAKELARIRNRRLVEVIASRATGGFWSRDGGRSMYVETADDVNKQIGFFKIDLMTGQTEKLLETEKAFGLTPILGTDANEEKVVYVAQDVQHGANLWLAGDGFAAPRQLSHLNSQLEKFAMGTSRIIRWEGLDGENLEGALLLPPGYKQARRYPVIVYVYGGDSGADYVNRLGLTGFGAGNLQLLATRGYVVFYPETRLSPERNMRDLAECVLTGVNKLVDLGIADPDRLGVMGGSLGGYSTLGMIVQTARFKAAAMISGFANLTTLYGQMENDGSSAGRAIIEEGLGMGRLWDHKDWFVENSPVFYLDRVQTPLLIIHGGADERVSPRNADEVFVNLSRLGKEVEYARYESGGHSLLGWRPADLVDHWSRIIRWFDLYLQPKVSGGSATDHSR